VVDNVAGICVNGTILTTLFQQICGPLNYRLSFLYYKYILGKVMLFYLKDSYSKLTCIAKKH
jgi:hypothetical protein